MNTIALVTLYFPDDKVRGNIIQLSKFVDKIVLLDNTPDADNSSLFSEIKNIEYIAYKKNLGLSEAFNHYLKTLPENCYIIFFDQDSFCPEGLVGQLKNDYQVCCVELNRKGIVGPAYFEENAGRLMVPKQKEEVSAGLYKVKSIITSGMFTELDVMRQAGFWNDEIFLDMADWDLCWRVERNDFFCCLSTNAVLTHRLGKNVHHFCGFEIEEWASFRVYYQTRDCLYLLRKAYVPFKFRIRFILMLTIRPVLYLIFLPDKKKRLHYFIKGINDFRKNIHGVLKGN